MILSVMILALMATVSPVRAIPPPSTDDAKKPVNFDTGELTLPLAALLAQADRANWFFAEGSTQPPFDTWFLVQNPTDQVAGVRFTFYLQPEGTVVHDVHVPPHARFSLFANEVIPNQAFSTWINSTVPATFAERAMYVSYDGDAVTGTTPSGLWLFAEGATVPPFHTWLLLQNPNIVPVPTTVTYLLEDGRTVTQRLTLLPYSRSSIFVNDVLPNAAFSMRVESGFFNVLAERAMYRFPGNAATVNTGVNAPSLNWFFAEGRTAFRGLDADTYLLLQNPNTTQATATVTLYDTEGRTATVPVALLPTSRLTLFLNPFVSGSFGIKVTSDIPIIAERSVFFGNEPRGAYSSQGATELSASWHLAEGETRAPFDELITVLNPQTTAIGVHADFELENAQVIGGDFTLGAESKLEILVDDIVHGANSVTIRTTMPSVVERTMFIFKQSHIGATDTIGVPQS